MGRKAGIGIGYIQPGQPQRNAYIERYNRTVRQKWLGQYVFESIEAVQKQATRWLWTHNHERPNIGIGGIGGITPAMKLKMAAQIPCQNPIENGGLPAHQRVTCVRIGHQTEQGRRLTT